MLHQKTIEIMQNEKFKAEADRLVKYYNITASAKYTLEPRYDFIKAIIRASLETA